MKQRMSGLTSGVKHFRRTAGTVFGSKYTEIIVAVSLFLLLDAGVLIVNFYTSYQIANDAHAIQLASRMGTLSQSLLHELYQVQEDIARPNGDYMTTIDRLAKSYKSFDETLDAFVYGGALIGEGQGQDSLLKDTVYRDTSAHLLNNAEDLWKDYRVKLKPVVYAYFNGLGRDELGTVALAAISYGRQQSGRLLELTQAFTNAVEGVAQRKAERLRLIQTIGICLAVLNFFLILFHFLKKLNQRDRLIEKSRKETADILENVTEGLFLLNRDYSIGSQHSTSLHLFFKVDTLAGRNFIDLLRPLVTEKTIDTVKEYADILFSSRVNETLITELNPLNRVKIHLTADATSFDIRYFSFQFSRVHEKDEFNALLVTVKDITESVRLSEQLQQANEKAGKEVSMLLAIIHVDSKVLTDFLQETENGLDSVNSILKVRDKGTVSLIKKLSAISLIIHKLKGDATGLGLSYVVEKLHRFETEIKHLKNRQGLSGEDFLPLVVHLNQLMTDFAVIRSLEGKMKSSDRQSFIGDAASSGHGASGNVLTALAGPLLWKKQMVTLVEQVAADYAKEVALDMTDLDLSLLSDNQYEPVKDIIVQSLRNAVAHGIETPLVREQAGKNRIGTLKVALTKNSSGLRLSIRDDGQGINLDKIRMAAVAHGLLAEDEANSRHAATLLPLIFRQGFSTEEHTGLHAGQGVGMNLVKSRIASLNGRINVRYIVGKFSEFQYYFDDELVAVN